MLLRASLAIVGLLAVLIGAVFIGQGTNAIHGSSMSGHGGYAWLGGVLVAIGLGLIIGAWRLRAGRAPTAQ